MEPGSKAAIAAAAAGMERKKRRAANGGQDTKPKGTIMRALFGIFPLLVIPVMIYVLVSLGYSEADLLYDTATGDVIGGRPEAPIMALLNEELIPISMISGVKWVLTKGDALVLLSIAFLFMEVLKSTSTGTATIMNHAVSMILFIVCLMLFLLNQNYATSVFFLLTVITLLDVLAGVVVTIVSARRDFGVGEGFGG